MKQPINRVRLTAGRVDAFNCPNGKPQAFLWDTDTPTLALRATPTGRKTYIFESRLNGATVRITIGTPTDWPIEKVDCDCVSLCEKIRCWKPEIGESHVFRLDSPRSQTRLRHKICEPEAQARRIRRMAKHVSALY